MLFVPKRIRIESEKRIMEETLEIQRKRCAEIRKELQDEKLSK